MTLLVLAEDGDETAARFARFATGRGVDTVVAAGFDRLSVTVTVSRGLRHRSTVLVDGRPPVGILCRGLPAASPSVPASASASAAAAAASSASASASATAAARFAAAERQAALWAAVALWPGPVVNRPTVYGCPPRLDPLELAASTSRIRAAGTLANGPDEPGNHAYRLDDHAELDPAARTPYDVVHVTRIDAGRTRRFLVAGAATFALGSPADRRALARRAREVATIRDWLHARRTEFAIVTVSTPDGDDGDDGDNRDDRDDKGDGPLLLLEASPWVSHHRFGPVEDAAYAALLGRLVP
ncbi:hypothetical protein ACIQUQ_05420 [Streptomyces sp. NPDC101118]|uniref:hypothetical protein n=1 Tax=Streptomyces sp. NPDC101118 TaxID=3366109 RepID=UPI0037F1448A